MLSRTLALTSLLLTVTGCQDKPADNAAVEAEPAGEDTASKATTMPTQATSKPVDAAQAASHPEGRFHVDSFKMGPDGPETTFQDSLNFKGELEVAWARMVFHIEGDELRVTNELIFKNTGYEDLKWCSANLIVDITWEGSTLVVPVNAANKTESGIIKPNGEVDTVSCSASLNASRLEVRTTDTGLQLHAKQGDEEVTITLVEADDTPLEERAKAIAAEATP